GVLALSGTPTSTTRWFENTLTLTVNNGVLRVSNAAGAHNNKINAIDITQVSIAGPGREFAQGFVPSPELSLNGSATGTGSVLRLTDGGASEAGSVFYASPIDVTRFTNQFHFRLTNPSADGFTFTIQGASNTALGGVGGGLGYGPDHVGGAGGIPKSVAVKFDLYNNQGEGTNSTGLYTNGAAPTNVGSI